MWLSLNAFSKKYKFQAGTIKNHIKRGKFPLDTYEIKNLLHQKKFMINEKPFLNYMFDNKYNFKKLKNKIAKVEVKYGS